VTAEDAAVAPDPLIGAAGQRGFLRVLLARIKAGCTGNRFRSDTAAACANPVGACGKVPAFEPYASMK